MPDPDNDRLSMPRAPRDRTWQDLRDENERMKGDIRRITQERDALVTAAARFMREQVTQTADGRWWTHYGGIFDSREMAEAAVRRVTGLDVTPASPAVATAPPPAP